MDIKEMTLGEWITGVGVKSTASLFRVDITTVYMWARALVLPRPEQMIKIVKLSNGRVTYQSMVEAVAQSSLRAKRARKAKKRYKASRVEESVTNGSSK